MKKIHWWQDSSNVRTCHLNTPSKTFKETLLASVYGSSDKGWVYVMSGSTEQIGPFETLKDVIDAVERAVSGEQVNTWD